MRKIFVTVAVALCSIVFVSETFAQWTPELVPGSQEIASLFTNGNSVFAGTFGLGMLVTTNNGNSWNTSGNGITNSKITAFAANGNRLYAGTYGAGAFVSI